MLNYLLLHPFWGLGFHALVQTQLTSEDCIIHMFKVISFLLSAIITQLPLTLSRWSRFIKSTNQGRKQLSLRSALSAAATQRLTETHSTQFIPLILLLSLVSHAILIFYSVDLHPNLLSVELNLWFDKTVSPYLTSSLIHYWFGYFLSHNFYRICGPNIIRNQHSLVLNIKVINDCFLLEWLLQGNCSIVNPGWLKKIILISAFSN